MKIEKDKVVEIHYTLRDEMGQVLDSTDGEPPLPYLHGAGNIVTGLEKALEGRAVGDNFRVTVTPQDGYGEYDDELREEIPLEAFPEGTELVEGDPLYTVDDEGNESEGYIEEIGNDTLIVNYNHPLAGQKLTFDVEVVDVRDATAEELAHGHAHDPYVDEDEDDEEWDDEEWEDEDDWDDDEEWEDEDDEDVSK